MWDLLRLASMSKISDCMSIHSYVKTMASKTKGERKGDGEESGEGRWGEGGWGVLGNEGIGSRAGRGWEGRGEGDGDERGEGWEGRGMKMRGERVMGRRGDKKERG